GIVTTIATATAMPVAAAEPPASGFGAFVLTTDADVAVLLCSPDGSSPDAGSHPQPTRACDPIRAAGGDVSNLPHDQHMMCPMIYDPTPASAVGVWADEDGPRAVDFSQTYGND